MISIERGSPLALYHQLKQMLLERIARGEFRPGAGASLDEELRTRGLRPGGRMLSARGRGSPRTSVEPTAATASATG